MIAIQIADFFILKHDSSNLDVKWTNFLLWAVGFGIYRVFMKIDTPVGNTLPVMIIVIVLCVVSSNVKQKFVSLNKED
jgi:purine-cytosine permease-like protein